MPRDFCKKKGRKRNITKRRLNFPQGYCCSITSHGWTKASAIPWVSGGFLRKVSRNHPKQRSWGKKTHVNDVRKLPPQNTWALKFCRKLFLVASLVVVGAGGWVISKKTQDPAFWPPGNRGSFPNTSEGSFSNTLGEAGGHFQTWAYCPLPGTAFGRRAISCL